MDEQSNPADPGGTITGRYQGEGQPNAREVGQVFNPPSWWTDGDTRQCSNCGKTRPHTIARICTQGRPVLCDDCHDERTTR